MATIVQSKVLDSSGASTYTITLDSAATNGNDIIYLGEADTQVHTGSCTFNGSNMTTDLDTNFGLWRIARFRVTGGGTDCVATLGGTSNYRGIIFEVSGLTSTPFEASVVKTATGEGSATSHSCEYLSGSANRMGFAWLSQGDPVTYTGANGATATAVSGNRGALYKDAIGSSAGSLDFTLNTAKAVDYMLATYLTSTSTSYTLTADSGSYALTGQAANTLFSSILTAAQGSYTLTGVDALLVRTGSYQFTADAGAYTLVGANALVDVSMVAGQGSYTLTGNDATLTYAPLTNRTLTAEAGTYALTGVDASTNYGRIMPAEVGVYALTGRQAGLIWSGAPVSTGYSSQKMTFSALTISL